MGEVVANALKQPSGDNLV